MRAKWLITGLLAVAMAGLTASVSAAQAAQQPQQQPAQQPAQQPKYTIQEYNDYQTAHNEKNAQQKAKLVEDFISKYPQSELLPYVYDDGVSAYNELRNYPKVVEFVDRLLSFGDKVVAWSRAQAIYSRCIAYQFSVKVTDPPDNAKKAIAAAETGVALVPQLQKPEQVPAEQWEAAKKQLLTVFHHTAGFASMQLKDFSSAVKHFKEALVSTPTDATSYYRLGVSYLSLQADGNSANDGFWALARAIGLKMPNEAQVRDYLKKQIARYEQPVCDTLVDKQMNELIALAGTQNDRPETFSIPGREQLNKVLEGASFDSIAADLKAGGDKAKLTWIAACGAEFPELGGKVFEATDSGDSVTLKVFTAGKEEDIRAGTAPNVEVKVEGQPQAAKLKPEDEIVYSGTISGWTPEPFMLQITKAKVKDEYLPKEEEKPAKAPAKKAPAKRPAKKPPSH